MNLLFLIPARSGSKGIPQKNFRVMCGRPLWWHTFTQAQAALAYLQTQGVDGVIRISTDAVDMFPESYKNFLIERPPELATDESPIIETIKHAIDVSQEQIDSGFDAVVLLQPTSPNRTVLDVAACVFMFKENGAKHGVVSGYQYRPKKAGKTDNKRNPEVFQRSGSVFVIPTNNIKNNLVLTGAEYEYACPKANGTDIDTIEDWELADAIMRYRKMEGKE